MLAIILNMFYLKKEGNTNSLIRRILLLFLTSTKSLQQAFNGKRRKYNSNLTIQGLLIKYHISLASTYISGSQIQYSEQNFTTDDGYAFRVS